MGMSLSSLSHLSFFLYGYFFLLPSNISFFNFPLGLDQPAINHTFSVSKSMGIDVYTLYTSCKKNFMNGFFSVLCDIGYVANVLSQVETADIKCSPWCA